MKLFLTSAGLPKETRKYFIKLLPKDPHKIKVAHITTAAYGETQNPHWLQISRDELIECGITKIKDIDIKGKSQKELNRLLKDKDIIYVNGGNTFYLLKCIKESGFDTVIKKLLTQGKIYVGVSAGSYVACPTIEQATWKHQDRNRVRVTNFRALDIVPFLVSAHFEEKYKDMIEQGVKDTSFPVVVLTDKQAVLCSNGAYKIVGEGNKILYTKDYSVLLPVDDWTLNLEQLVLNIAKTAKREKREYYIGGGLALDITHGDLTRFHEDLDFYPMEQDRKFWKEWFDKIGFETKQEPWTRNYPNAFIVYDEKKICLRCLSCQNWEKWKNINALQRWLARRLEREIVERY